MFFGIILFLGSEIVFKSALKYLEKGIKTTFLRFSEVIFKTSERLFLKVGPKSLTQGGPGSVRFGYSLEMERFERFWFPVPAVPLQKGFFCISAQFNGKGRFRFRFLENGSGGSGSAFGFGKNVRDKFPHRGFCASGTRI